jgi:hypothetical protein
MRHCKVMSSAVNTTKEIAKSLRGCKHMLLKARVRGERVFVTTDQPTWAITDLLPPGWGARLVPGKYDRLVVQWVG